MNNHLTIGQAPLSMEFSSKEYWSGLPFPSPGDLPNPGIEPGSSTLRRILHCLGHQGNHLINPMASNCEQMTLVGFVAEKRLGSLLSVHHFLEKEPAQ